MGPCEKSRGEERGESSKERQSRGKKRKRDQHLQNGLFIYRRETGGRGGKFRVGRGGDMPDRISLQQILAMMRGDCGQCLI